MPITRTAKLVIPPKRQMSDTARGPANGTVYHVTSLRRVPRVGKGSPARLAKAEVYHGYYLTSEQERGARHWEGTKV